MPFTATYQKKLTHSASDKNVTFTDTYNLSNNSKILISENVPSGTNQVLNVKNIAGLTSFLTIKTDKPCTIKTNSITTPDNTFVLTGSNNNSILYVQTGASLSKSTLVGISSSESLKNFETLAKNPFCELHFLCSSTLSSDCVNSLCSSRLTKSLSWNSLFLYKLNLKSPK